MPKVFRLLSLATLSAILVLSLAGSTYAATPTTRNAVAETEFLNLINQHRLLNNLSVYTLNTALSTGSCSWTQSMADANNLQHDPNLEDALTSSAPDWTNGGENVGTGSPGASVTSLHDAFVASPTHDANLLSPTFKEIGVCVLNAQDGTIWVTQRFVAAAFVPATTTKPGRTTPPAATQPTPTTVFSIPVTSLPASSTSPSTTAPSTTASSTTTSSTTTSSITASSPTSPSPVDGLLNEYLDRSVGWLLIGIIVLLPIIGGVAAYLISSYINKRCRNN